MSYSHDCLLLPCYRWARTRETVLWMWSDEASTITSPFLSRKKDSAGCGVKVSTKVRGKFHNIWGRPLLSMVPISTFHTQGSIDTIMTMYGYLDMQICLKLGMSKYFYNDRETSLPAEGGPRLACPGRNVKLGCWAAGLVPRSVCVQALLGPPPVLWTWGTPPPTTTTLEERTLRIGCTQHSSNMDYLGNAEDLLKNDPV